MKYSITIKLLSGLFALFASAVVFGGNFQLEIDDPTWCRGLDRSGQCVTYFGSRKSCEHLEPCNTFEAANFHTPWSSSDIHFCYGLNGFDQCVLYMGPESSCKNLNPC